MSEAINAHKKMAMGITEGNVMKKGGKVAKYAGGGKVMSEKGVDKLPARGDKRNGGVDFNAGKAKVATLKKGGKAGLGIMIAIGKPMKKPAGRGR
jgi:hypothetical protein